MDQLSGRPALKKNYTKEQETFIKPVSIQGLNIRGEMQSK